MKPLFDLSFRQVLIVVGSLNIFAGFPLKALLLCYLSLVACYLPFISWEPISCCYQATQDITVIVTWDSMTLGRAKLKGGDVTRLALGIELFYDWYTFKVCASGSWVGWIAYGAVTELKSEFGSQKLGRWWME